MSDAVLYFRRAPAAPAAQSVGGSPATIANNSPSIQVYTVTGGVVTLIEIDAGSGFLPAIGIAGVYVLMPTNTIRMTYVVTPPTVSMVQL